MMFLQIIWGNITKKFVDFHKSEKKTDNLKKSVDFCRGMWYDIVVWVYVSVCLPHVSIMLEKEVFL